MNMSLQCNHIPWKKPFDNMTYSEVFPPLTSHVETRLFIPSSGYQIAGVPPAIINYCAIDVFFQVQFSAIRSQPPFDF